MAQQNSTLTLSTCHPATSVSSLEHESSPKHDVSLSEGEMGFILLIDCDSKQILAQREGVNDEASFEDLKTYVWNLNEEVAVQFVAQTDHVHPTKFFCSLPKDGLAKCYLNQPKGKIWSPSSSVWKAWRSNGKRRTRLSNHGMPLREKVTRLARRNSNLGMLT
ncbi:protein of unknown function [Vibrio tapetis subsp. tapetis]|uniref:Uncharacterized protein n=1 Tax=Vibrio tapetis subsp. tapetis TaxID=1671868 RepID=A0A2N8ZIB3_9VIBR|nr:protein of unknown function [Vibrio tapetis subsp. tapetis]